MEHDLLPVYEKKIGIYVSMIMIDFLIIHTQKLQSKYLKRYFFCKQKHDLNIIPPTLFHIKACREFDQ